MATPAAPSAMLEMQHQIRTNAANLQDYFSDLYSWEKTIDQEDSARRKRGGKGSGGDSCRSKPPPRVRQSVVVGGAAGAAVGKAADAHTYDKGYKRWEKFDVEAALKEADEGDNAHAEEVTQTSKPTLASAKRAPKPKKATAAAAISSKEQPRQTKSRAEIEREEGNEHYKRGDYVAAIKSYTRCLGLDPQNAVVLSNRAMALIKNREFAKAEDDCSLALKVDPTHVKSYLRRGTARNALGKHRLALLDFEKSAGLDPKNRQIQAQLVSTRDLIRAAIKRAPKRTDFIIKVVNDPPPAPKVDTMSTKIEIIDDDDDKGTEENKENASGQRATASENSKTQQQSTTAEHSITKERIPVRKAPSVPLPSLPKKAPQTSYEFTRVWKTFAPKGDTERRAQLLSLRAQYLRMVQPSSLRSIFKNAIESDLLCEIFSVLRSEILSREPVEKAAVELSLSFAQELTHVPRFSMSIMFLSDKEKQDMQWVADRLRSEFADQSERLDAVAKLKQAYELS